MKRISVKDVANRPVRIFLLQDADLFFCVPFTLLSAVTYLAMGFSLKLLILPLSHTMRLFRKLNISLTWALALFPVVVAVATYITAAIGPFSLADLAGALIVLVYGLTIRGKFGLHYQYLEDQQNLMPPGGPISPREASTFARLRAEALSLPDACVRHKNDKTTAYLGLIRTVLVLPYIVFLLIVPSGWLHYALITYLVLFFFNNTESIEHIAAHTRSGRLLVPGQAPFLPRALEALRRYTVWPLYGWYPDYYYVTHTLHHHIENNGPADWLSTIRYNRSSVLDFCKVVTWLSINHIFPFDTMYYLVQKRRFRILRTLMRGWLSFIALLILLAFVEPLLFGILLWIQLFGFACHAYVFLEVWHGFHDPKRPYNVESSSNNLGHYLHHKKPRIHLWDATAANGLLAATPRSAGLVLVKNEQGTGSWFLQGLLWKKEFEEASQSLLQYEHLVPQDVMFPYFLRSGIMVDRGVDSTTVMNLVGSFFPTDRRVLLQKFDHWLSYQVGTVLCRLVNNAGKAV